MGNGTGVGARLLRKEDDRFLRGRGQYIGDIKLAGTRDVVEWNAISRISDW